MNAPKYSTAEQYILPFTETVTSKRVEGKTPPEYTVKGIQRNEKENELFLTIFQVLVFFRLLQCNHTSIFEK